MTTPEATPDDTRHPSDTEANWEAVSDDALREAAAKLGSAGTKV